MTAARRPRPRRPGGGAGVAGAVIGLAAAQGVTTLLRGVTSMLGTVLGVPLDAPALSPSPDVPVTYDSAVPPQLVGQGIALVGAFMAFAVGGYVAARLARSHGTRHGVAVWAGGLLYGAAMQILALGGLGSVTGFLAALPRADMVSLLLVLALQLVGAVIGGRAGARVHRRVDGAALAPDGPVASGG